MKLPWMRLCTIGPTLAAYHPVSAGVLALKLILRKPAWELPMSTLAADAGKFSCVQLLRVHGSSNSSSRSLAQPPLPAAPALPPSPAAPALPAPPDPPFPDPPAPAPPAVEPPAPALPPA